MDRFTWLATRDERAAARPSGPTLADALTDREIALIRIRCRGDRSFRRYHDLVAFTTQFRRLSFHPTDPDTDLAARVELVLMVFNAWPDVDWSRDHQVVVATGEVQSAPDAWEHGFVPEDDLAFGGGPATYTTRSWADTPAVQPVTTWRAA